MGEIVFVTGGARSGKSRWALEYALKQSGKKLFVATAIPKDEEMLERVKKHKEERGKEWDLAEEGFNLASALTEKGNKYDVILVDCLTLWVSNLMMCCDENEIAKHFDALLGTLKKSKQKIILVSNDVGMGIVPINELARKFRDMAGILNQKIARMADKAVLMVSGLPVYLTG